jgi:hypothetical protein
MDLFGGFLDWRFLAGADSLRGGEEAPQAEPLHLSRTSKYKVSKLDGNLMVGLWIRFDFMRIRIQNFSSFDA